ncbi:hypothetical protein MW887_004294 [Aspergillus wentii]|nr:hypothetical protein MW887_004294 [Aspergillus wentii]
MTDGTRCEDTKQLRILGYAWIGPQPPYPRGAQNPFIIGFKAWQSDKALSEIYTAYDQIKWDGDVCPSQPDLFRIVTTRSSASNDETSDTMNLDIFSNSTLPGAAQFNATTATGLNTPISDDVGLFRLRAGTCTSSTTDMHWPDTTSMQGSVTNTTMELTFSGSVDMNSTQYQRYGGRNEDLKVNFKLTFSGTFDSVNSTHAVDIGPADQSTAWVPNTAGSIFSAGLR